MRGKPKENNRHAYGKGHGKLGKKHDRIQRMIKRLRRVATTNTTTGNP